MLHFDKNKEEIANKIKPITFETINKEMNNLHYIGYNASNESSRCRIGNNIVDYYTFAYRLETKGKYNINFYEFVDRIEDFKEKKFIKNMFSYYENVKNKKGNMNYYVVLKEIYNICISAINIIRPLVYMEIYAKYNPKHVLDFCAGWGGAAVASAVLPCINSYTGIEINHSLKEPYNQLTTFLHLKTKCKINMIFEDSLNINYLGLYYDFVFTSPPYYFIQKYSNNTIYENKKDMNELFYRPLFKKVYDGLQINGYFIINICKEVYENILIEMFGNAIDIYPYKKSKRQNNYQELCYVWQKLN
jgi:hypothetical protein